MYLDECFVIVPDFVLVDNVFPEVEEIYLHLHREDARDRWEAIISSYWYFPTLWSMFIDNIHTLPWTIQQDQQIRIPVFLDIVKSEFKTNQMNRFAIPNPLFPGFVSQRWEFIKENKKVRKKKENTLSTKKKKVFRIINQLYNFSYLYIIIVSVICRFNHIEYI